jgi:hypothetical protein
MGLGVSISSQLNALIHGDFPNMVGYSKYNRLWTADQLEKRGWNNCDICPLCKQTQEMAATLILPL